MITKIEINNAAIRQNNRIQVATNHQIAFAETCENEINHEYRALIAYGVPFLVFKDHQLVFVNTDQDLWKLDDTRQFAARFADNEIIGYHVDKDLISNLQRLYADKTIRHESIHPARTYQFCRVTPIMPEEQVDFRAAQA